MRSCAYNIVKALYPLLNDDKFSQLIRGHTVFHPHDGSIYTRYIRIYNCTKCKLIGFTEYQKFLTRQTCIPFITQCVLFFFFESIRYIPVNNFFSQNEMFSGLKRYLAENKDRLAEGYNTVPLLRLD